MPDTEQDWYSPEAATFGDRVAGAREHAEMNQGQLARRLGIKKSTLIAWEDDMSEPRANKLSMMAGLLNVSIMWLLTGEGDGMTGPVEDSHPSPGVKEVLSELREIRAEVRASAEKLGLLEKKLRSLDESGPV